MKKVIKYNICNRVNVGTEDEPEFEERLMGVKLTWSEANEEIAKREAHNVKYTVDYETGGDAI